MTRSAPAPLDTLSDAESARGQKKSPLLPPPPSPPSEEFLVAKVNALESSWAKPSRRFACSRVIVFLEDFLPRIDDPPFGIAFFTFCSLRLSSRVSRFSKLSTSISFSSFHRVGEILNFNFFEPIVESILFEICKAFFFFFFFWFPLFVVELEGSSLCGKGWVGMSSGFSFFLKNFWRMQRNFEFVKFSLLSSMKSSNSENIMTIFIILRYNW